MKRLIVALLSALCLNIPAMAKTKTVTLRLVETSDVHGSFFPYDFINRKPKKGSLARVVTYVKGLRQTYGKNLILVDNGDILQGQPVCYYYNYVKTDQPNIAASIINYMQYDAEAVGNHDIETGHPVYDKWFKEVKCPMVGANIVDVETGQPYVKPYTLLMRDGVKIAILGMITPAIPNWLNESLWKGLRFDDIVKSASYWVHYLQENEHPDVIVGLFHSGKEGGIKTEGYEENESMDVAKEVPGFDLIFYGHDHTCHQDVIKNKWGKDVVCLDPANNAYHVSDATITLQLQDGKVTHKDVKGTIVDVTGLEVDKDFIQHFQPNIDSVNAFVNRKIGTFEHTITTRDCFFGSSAFTDFIHNMQLKLTGADISFNAPLSFDASIQQGDVHVSDLFNLYKYENQVYMLRMTGKEIRQYLEMSYDLWVNTMKSPNDHIMLLNEEAKGDMQRYGFKNLTFNFDSAAGIDYTVDVTKPNGQKVKILKMSNGKPFDEEAWYLVAMNSYRGNGGGELLTKGAGIPHDEIQKRIVFESKHDQRYYLIEEIEKAGTINPQPNNNWKFVPDEWARPAIARDRALIFSQKSIMEK